MNSYELVYALVPNLPEEEVNEMHEVIKSHITSTDGTIKSFNDWGVKKLAYPIKHYYEAPYFFIEFDALPASIDELKNIIRLDSASLRFAVVKIEKDFSKRKMPKRRPPRPSYSNDKRESNRFSKAPVEAPKKEN